MANLPNPHARAGSTAEHLLLVPQLFSGLSHADDCSAVRSSARSNRVDYVSRRQFPKPKLHREMLCGLSLLHLQLFHRQIALETASFDCQVGLTTQNVSPKLHHVVAIPQPSSYTAKHTAGLDPPPTSAPPNPLHCTEGHGGLHGLAACALTVPAHKYTAQHVQLNAMLLSLLRTYSICLTSWGSKCARGPIARETLPA